MNTKTLLNAIAKHRNNTEQYWRMTDIAAGNMSSYVLDSIARELKPESYKVASQRIAPINVFQKITNKLSKVYSDSPKRAVTSPRDQEIVDQIATTAEIQDTMANAELMLNINRQFALEPYLNANDEINVRVLGPYEFVVLSDDDQNPYKPTHYVKFMGKQTKGKKQVEIYWVYTSTTFTVLDSDGDVHDEQENPYGQLPAVFCSQNKFTLMPKPDIDSFNVSILVPKLLTDLNYAVQFQSHSIMYGIDLDASGLDGSADAFWSIKSAAGSDKHPQLGVLSPTVDIASVLSLITFTVSQWLDTRGIKPGNVGSLNPENAASGVAKIIDEADTSQVVQKNRLLLVKAEKQLWQLIGKIHNLYLAESSRGIEDPLNVSISFPTQTPIADPAEAREKLKFQLEQGLTSKWRALKESHPDLSDAEIEILKTEIENEKKPVLPEQVNINDENSNGESNE